MGASSRPPAQRLPKLQCQQSETSMPEPRRRRRSRAENTAAASATRASDGSQLEVGQPCEKPVATVGQTVLVTGLVHAPQFNGRWARIQSYDAALNRYIVRIYQDKEEVVAKLRPQHLVFPKDEQP